MTRQSGFLPPPSVLSDSDTAGLWSGTCGPHGHSSRYDRWMAWRSSGGVEGRPIALEQTGHTRPGARGSHSRGAPPPFVRRGTGGTHEGLVQVSHLLLQLCRPDAGEGHAHHDHTPRVEAHVSHSSWVVPRPTTRGPSSPTPPLPSASPSPRPYHLERVFSAEISSLDQGTES